MRGNELVYHGDSVRLDPFPMSRTVKGQLLLFLSSVLLSCVLCSLSSVLCSLFSVYPPNRTARKHEFCRQTYKVCTEELRFRAYSLTCTMYIPDFSVICGAQRTAHLTNTLYTSSGHNPFSTDVRRGASCRMDCATRERARKPQTRVRVVC